MTDKLTSATAADDIRTDGSRSVAPHDDSWLDTSPVDHMRNMLHLVRQSRGTRELAARDRARVPELEQENADLREKLETAAHREANARYLATHDGLTGLANRSLLMDRYIQAAAHAQRNHRPIALLVFDLDGFKAINDEHGHLVGDRVLQRIAHELEGIARAGDTACRYGGDEFVLLLASIDSIADARVVADKVQACIVDALRVEDIAIDVSASCGIAMYPDDGTNWHELMQSADMAMYRSKPRAANDESAPPSPMRSHARNHSYGASRVAMAAGPVIAGNGGQAAEMYRFD